MPSACEPRRLYRSSSPISIVTGWSSGSNKARARRIDTSFSRPSCLRYCMNGGASRARRAGCLPVSPGCFPATAESIPVRVSSTASFAWQRGVPALPNVWAFTHCGTALPHISWNKNRYSDHPGFIRSRDILPANTRSRGGFTTRFIPGAARVCLFSGNTPTVMLSWSSFRSPTGRSPAYRRG